MTASLGEYGFARMIRTDLPARADRPAVFIGVRRLPLAVLACALALSVALSIAANFVLFKSTWLDGPMHWGQGLISGTLIANLGLILFVVVLCLGLWGGARARDLGLKRNDLEPAVALTLATWLFLNALNLAGAFASGQTVQTALGFENAVVMRKTLGDLLGQLFGNALYEEILFRAVLLVQFVLWLEGRRPQRKRGNLCLALLASQAIFALQHIPNRLAFGTWSSGGDVALDMTGVFVSGLFFAGVFVRTRNLLLAIGMHTLANLPSLWFTGPDWVHPVGMAVALLLFMALGPRLSRAAPKQAPV